jgi:hypothetical protein
LAGSKVQTFPMRAAPGRWPRPAICWTQRTPTPSIDATSFVRMRELIPQSKASRDPKVKEVVFGRSSGCRWMTPARLRQGLPAPSSRLRWPPGGRGDGSRRISGGFRCPGRAGVRGRQRRRGGPRNLENWIPCLALIDRRWSYSHMMGDRRVEDLPVDLPVVQLISSI